MPDKEEFFSLFRRYGISAAVLVASFFITATLPALSQASSLFTLLGAILFSTWYGGLGPGLFSTLFSALKAQRCSPCSKLNRLRGYLNSPIHPDVPRSMFLSLFLGSVALLVYRLSGEKCSTDGLDARSYRYGHVGVFLE